MSKQTANHATSANTPNRRQRTLVATALSLAITGAMIVSLATGLSPIAPAHAQESGGHEDHDQGGGHEDQGRGGGRDGEQGQGNRGAGERGQAGSGSGSVQSEVLREDVGAEEEDSDRRGPHYGGGRDATGKPAGAGTGKGDLFGDLYVILRDDNGVPILDQFGHVQPIDAQGNLIPINEDGEVDEANAALIQEVELGRLNVGRSPDKVTDKSYDEALASLNAASAIRVDESGRIVVTIDGVEKTIDSPLENMALYIALMENGYLPGLDLQDGVSLGSLSYLADTAFTNDDMMMAATLLAAASDKAGTITRDEVVYLSTMLTVDGVNPITGADGRTYVDYSSATYDRSDTYIGDVTFVRNNGDGTFTLLTESIMTAVFGGTDYTGTKLDAFAQAAEDARAVIEFIHDHPVPAL